MKIGETYKQMFGMNTGITKLPFITAIYQTLAGKLHPKSIKVGKYDLLLDNGDSTRLSQWDVPFPEEQEYYARTLKKGMIIVDVGASLGFFTLLFAEKAEQVLSFEPLPETYELLKQTVNMNKLRNVLPINLALADFNGKTTLNLAQGNVGGGSVAHDLNKGKTIEVDVVKLDDIYLDRIDLIKIDVEGAELMVLKGAEGRLRRDKPTIVFEFNPAFMKDYGIGLLNYLEGIGYSIRTLDGKEIHKHKLIADLAEKGTFTNLEAKQ